MRSGVSHESFFLLNSYITLPTRKILMHLLFLYLISAQPGFVLLMEVVDDARSQDVIRVHVTSFFVQRKCDYSCCDILLYCMTLSSPLVMTQRRHNSLFISV